MSNLVRPSRTQPGVEIEMDDTPASPRANAASSRPQPLRPRRARTPEKKSTRVTVLTCRYGLPEGLEFRRLAMSHRALRVNGSHREGGRRAGSRTIESGVAFGMPPRIVHRAKGSSGSDSTLFSSNRRSQENPNGFSPWRNTHLADGGAADAHCSSKATCTADPKKPSTPCTPDENNQHPLRVAPRGATNIDG